MHYYFLFSWMVFFTSGIYAQKYFQSASLVGGKPPVDSSLFDKWPSVERPSLSNDGHYALYTICNQPVAGKTLVFHQLEGDWKMEFPDGSNAAFCDDSRRAVFLKRGDILCLLSLGTSIIEYIPHVQSFRFFKRMNSEWLALQLDTPVKELLIRNLETGETKSFSAVSDYSLSQDGSILVLKIESKKDTVVMHSLKWVNLLDWSSKVICEGVNADNLVLDNAGKQVAFVIENSINGEVEKSFWYYKEGTDRAVLLVNNQSAGMDPDLQLNGIQNFSKDGNRLFMRLGQAATKPKADMIKVDIWSYTDALLQSEQLIGLGNPETYEAVIGINDRNIVRLQQKGETAPVTYDPVSDDFVFFDARKGDREEVNWSMVAQPGFFMVSTRNGKRKQISLDQLEVSPDGKYAVGYEPQNNGLCSYDLLTGQFYNISEAIPVPLLNDENSLQPTKQILFAVWLAGKSSLIVYDKYDIWQVDPSGKSAPINVTNGYGRKNNIQFHLVSVPATTSFVKTVAANEKIVLHAFNLSSKEEGFFNLSLNKPGNPERLIMGPYDFKHAFVDGQTPVKARDAEIYLLRRSSETESPNYFWTRDLKEFIPISDVYPERMYNWLKTELVSFRTLEDSINQGVIYKPENFDSSKKYPVIIQYYEQKSANLHTYRSLYDEDDISIPWFVSHGYVVFTPDIHFKMGKNGQCAYNAITGAAAYLSNFHWVDSLHIGIEGHSFGGFETNYLVTHTGRFAAAISSCGISDLIGHYGELWGNTNSWGAGPSAEGYYENRQGRMGVALWENPDIYIKGSPIFYVDKVTTPILIMANMKDGNVHFNQGLEFFLALRRLGKKAWMLQYDQGGHGVVGKSFIDFTLRSQQFFDHYLRGAAAPKWMVEGIRASRKGIDNGLGLSSEVDANGKPITPGPGLLTPEEQKKVDALKHRKPITVTFN
jgi:hypothetical protein